jgi:glycosyltransferase involved in cell wall biosynthesis
VSLKRILLVGCDYFPLSTPGSFRLYAFARHLGEFGYEPHILALDWDRTNVAGGYWSADCLDPESPADPCPVTRFYYRFPGGGRLRRSLRQYTVRGLFPISWHLSLTRRFVDHMERLHARQAFHVVLATVPHYMPMAAAYCLHRKNGLPWVIDFRDIKGQWPMLKPWRKPWRWSHPAYEGWAVFCQSRLARRASAGVTVSQPLAKTLEGQGVAKVHVVYNGFAPEEFPAFEPRAGRVFRMVYAGTLVPERRSPAPVLEALDLLCRSGKIAEDRFSLDFYGTGAEQIERLTRGHPCAPLVHGRARLGKRAIHEIMADAGILLHLSTEGAKGILTSKLTEYLGTRRPILTVPGDGDVVDEFLMRTHAGVSLKNPAAIAAWVLGQYEHWKTHGEYLIPDIVDEEVEKYTWRRQVERLARLLEAVRVGDGHALGHGSHTPVQ